MNDYIASFETKKLVLFALTLFHSLFQIGTFRLLCSEKAGKSENQIL